MEQAYLPRKSRETGKKKSIYRRKLTELEKKSESTENFLIRANNN